MKRAGAKILNWQVLEKRPLNDYRVFRTRAERARSPRTGVEHEFYVIEGGDWVNVIPLTPKREVVLVEQYRHGSKRVELEIPGGIIDESDRSPVHAAGRELLEETGYRGRRGVLLGKLRPNPAIQENTLNAVLIEDAVASGPVSFDPAEDIRIALCPLSKIDSLIASGRIAHSLVIAAFYLLKLRRPELWLSGRRTAKASRR